MIEVSLYLESFLLEMWAVLSLFSVWKSIVPKLMVILERSLSSFLWWDGSWTCSSTFPLLALLQGSWNSSTSLVNVPFHPGWDPVLSSSGLGYIEIHFTLDRIFQEKQEIFLTIRSRRFKFYFNFIYSLIKSSWEFFMLKFFYTHPPFTRK